MRSLMVGLNNNFYDHRNGIVAGVGNKSTSRTMTLGNVLGSNLTQNRMGANGLLLVGQYNDTIASNYQFVVGTGTSSEPKNGLILDTSGNLTIAGSISANSIHLKDANGKVYEITVDTSGNLVATAQGE